MRVIDFGFSDISLDERFYENILIYDIPYKTLMGVKTLHICFEKIYGFIKIYDGITYLVLFASERYNAIYDRINYLIIEKSDIAYSINYNFARIRIGSDNSLPIEKTFTFHHV